MKLTDELAKANGRVDLKTIDADPASPIGLMFARPGVVQVVVYHKSGDTRTYSVLDNG